MYYVLVQCIFWINEAPHLLINGVSRRWFGCIESVQSRGLSQHRTEFKSRAPCVGMFGQDVSAIRYFCVKEIRCWCFIDIFSINVYVNLYLGYVSTYPHYVNKKKLQLRLQQKCICGCSLVVWDRVVLFYSVKLLFLSAALRPCCRMPGWLHGEAKNQG